MPSPRYKLTYTVPPSHLSATKTAIFATGAGTWDNGKYVNVCFETRGKGEFVPSSAGGATPHTGAVDATAETEEVCVEVVCGGEKVTRDAVAALKRTHPYEVVAYDVVKLEDF